MQRFKRKMHLKTWIKYAKYSYFSKKKLASGKTFSRVISLDRLSGKCCNLIPSFTLYYPEKPSYSGRIEI